MGKGKRKEKRNSEETSSPVLVNTVDPVVATTTVESTTQNPDPLTNANTRTIWSVAPEDVLIDPKIHALRAWSGVSEQEASIPELARTMIEEGQQLACVCRVNGDGDLVLVSGARRREALLYAREQAWMNENGEFPLLNVVVEREMSDAEALRAALLENVQRADFTPIELMHNIQTIREMFHTETDPWIGAYGTAKVADFLGVSPATVTETEKLALLPSGVQDKVQNGLMTKYAALELVAQTAKTPEPEKKAEVAAEILTEAQEIADVEARLKRDENERKRQRIAQERVSGRRKTGKTGATTGITVAEAGGGDKQPEEETTAQTDAEDRMATAVASVADSPNMTGRVTGRHVRQAAARVAKKKGQGESEVVRAPRMSELTEMMEAWDGPAYPGVMRGFSRGLAAWGHGKLVYKKLEALWDDLADALTTAKPVPATPRAKNPQAKKKATPAKKAVKPNKKKKK